MRNKKQNIVTLIKEDHKLLLKDIQVLLKDGAKPHERKSSLLSFLRNLKLHAEAEEMSLYQNEQHEKALRSSVLEAFVEHALAETLSRTLEKQNLSNEVSEDVMAKGRVLAELVKHHIEEEETKFLVKLRKVENDERLQELGHLYLQAKLQLQSGFQGAREPGGLQDSTVTSSSSEERGHPQ